MGLHSKKAALGLTLLLLAGAAVALDAPQIISARQDSLKTLGKTVKALNEELGKPELDRALVVSDIQTIEKLAVALPSWFPAGSGAEAGVKTAARPEIWTSGDKFQQAASDFATQAHKLASLAATGDADTLKAQLKATGGTCGACHKEFKRKDD